MQLLFIDRPRAACSERLNATLELNKRSNMLAIVRVDSQHVALEKKAIPEWLLSPVVVAGLLPDFSRFSTERQKPIVGIATQRDVFDGVPEVLPEASVAQKTPVLILPQQLVTPIVDYRWGCSHCLGVGAWHSSQEGRRQD